MVIAVAGLVRARTMSNESGAVASLRAINTAQAAYSAVCGGGNYATSLVILGMKSPSGSQGFIDVTLAGATEPLRNGYRFRLQGGLGAVAGPRPDCNSQTTQTTYYATAIPAEPGSTGSRAFATNQKGSVYQLPGAVPPAEPFGPPAELAQ
jgi:hypothetical protein